MFSTVFRLGRYVPVASAVVALGCSRVCAAVPSPRELFEDKCAPCHGVDGKARTPAGKKLGAKDLSESKLEETQIERQIRDGAKDQRGAEKMPPFRDKLASAEITALVGYVKTFRPASR